MGLSRTTWASRIAIKMMLPPLLFLLMHNGLVAATEPLYSLPFDSKTDWRYDAYRDIVRQGFRDAVTIARVVVLTGSDCDDAFLRCKCPEFFQS